jgi:hypothetical protein
MLFKLSLVLLICWLVGLFGPFDIGKPVHLPLLLGLMCFFLGLLKARDAASSHQQANRSDHR